MKHFPFSSWIRAHQWLVLAACLTLAYAVSRFPALTSLPIFADEAIYIRWSQLLRNGAEYFFFSMNDGKPPLFVWTLYPWLSIFRDPLWAARAWSATIGLLQMFVLMGVARSLALPRRAQILAAALVILTPFWFLHHRLALMDGLLTLGISVSWLGLIQLDARLRTKQVSWNAVLGWTAVAALGWGVALLTKTTALFWAPAFAGLAVWGYQWGLNPRKIDWTLLRSRVLAFGAAGALGLGLFGLLKLTPIFGSLFQRSSDFTYSFSQWLELGGLPLWSNLQRVVPWLAEYFRPELVSFALLSLVLSVKKRQHWLTWALGLITIAPLIILGKTLHPRYFFPLAPFLTISAAAFGSETMDWLAQQWQNKQRDAALVAGALVAFFLITAVRFQLLLQWSPHLTPFVLDDREQYLTSWAAGYGIPQTRDRLLERARAGQRTTVVTEGSFGTLPDGLLLYFDRAPEIQHLRIEGLEQHPVRQLPDWVIEHAATEETWLLVNADRFALSPVQSAMVELIDSTPKPYGGPPLQLYRVTPQAVE